MDMKVSIIMCAYNVEEFIERAIESIIMQSYQNWELIISNDASTDKTLSIIRKYTSDARIILIDQFTNLGYVKNKNLAFAAASGELLTQLDADDTCPPDRIEKQVNVFLRHPEIQICGTNYQQVDTSDVALAPQEYSDDFLIDVPKDIYPFWYPGLMFRKGLLSEVGYFSEYFTGIYGDDYYWTIRVNKKYPIYFINDVLYNYRINPNSLTNVFDNPRKLIVSEIVLELLRQQQQKGSDWLQEGETHKMKDFEQKLLGDTRLMAEKYRLWAAKAIDKKDLKLAKRLLVRSVKLRSTNKDIYKTMLYYLRRNIFN